MHLSSRVKQTNLDKFQPARSESSELIFFSRYICLNAFNVSAVLRENRCVGVMAKLVILSCDVAASATSRSRLINGHHVLSEV